MYFRCLTDLTAKQQLSEEVMRMKLVILKSRRCNQYIRMVILTIKLRHSCSASLHPVLSIDSVCLI